MKSKEKESDIVRAVCEYLALRKAFYWRSNNIPAYDTKGKFFRRMPFGALKGVPDIIVVDKTGHFVGLEVKASKGVLSQDQIAFRRRCLENGSEYHVIRSVEQLQELGL